jgi:hypothetical protein
MAQFPHHTGGVIQVECNGRWGSIPEALIEDERLGLDTRAVAAWLAMKANGWQISVQFLRQRLRLKEERWLRMAKEMENAGYFQRQRMQGSWGRWVWNIVFTPISSIPGFSVHGLAVPGSSMHGQPGDKSNTKLTNTNLATTTTTAPPDGAGAAGGGVHVFFEELPTDFQDKARQMLEGLAPELQADAVDELLGQIEEHVAKQPERLLRTLAKAAREGGLSLDYARRYRERRRTREAAAVARQVATVLPEDDRAKKKGASLMQRLAPSIASKIHSGSHS